MVRYLGFAAKSLTVMIDAEKSQISKNNEFNDKYYKEIVELFSYPPPMSPTEFKQTIYELTVYNPELVMQQIPWFEMRKIENIEYYHMTEFGYEVIIFSQLFTVIPLLDLNPAIKKLIAIL